MNKMSMKYYYLSTCMSVASYFTRIICTKYTFLLLSFKTRYLQVCILPYSAMLCLHLPLWSFESFFSFCNFSQLDRIDCNLYASLHYTLSLSISVFLDKEENAFRWLSLTPVQMDIKALFIRSVFYIHDTCRTLNTSWAQINMLLLAAFV